MADNTNQIIFPAEWGALRGRIAPSVQDSPSTYTIYARRKNGAYMDITGQTPTAKFTSTTAGGSVYTSTGTFTVTDGEAGEFTWLPSAADLGLDGSYYLQFTIDGERSEDRLRWVIQERLDSSGSVTPTAMAAITADELALVTALGSALPAAEGDIFKYTGGAWTTTAESGGGGASDVTDLTTTTGLPAQRLRVAGAGGLEYRTTEQDLADLQDAGALTTTDIGVIVQGYSAKTAAIAALTWAANSIILLTGTATASVQALAAHVVTFLQSANAADARAAIGAAALGANTFSGEQNLADQLLTRPVIKDYGETVNAIGSTGGGTQDIDLTLGNVVSATVDTSANTFTFSNPSASGTACSFTLFLTNGGSQTVNWPASVDWAGGTAPTLTASGRDVLTFTTLDGGTIWYGFAAGLEMS